jgi:hypothetical protein
MRRSFIFDNLRLGEKMKSGTTEYSAEIEGTTGNYNYPVRFDITDGFLGVDQTKDGQIERVLLSPQQVKELIAFVKRWPK